MTTLTEIDTVLNCYPRIFFACHMRHVRDVESQRELSRQQASVLDHLDDKEGTSVAKLASHLGVTASTMSLTLDRLERGGYVRRQKDVGDGRRTLVRLTESGGRIKGQQKVLEPKLVAALLNQLSTAKRKEALAGLRLLAGAADQMMQESTFHERRKTSET